MHEGRSGKREKAHLLTDYEVVLGLDAVNSSTKGKLSPIGTLLRNRGSTCG